MSYVDRGEGSAGQRSDALSSRHRRFAELLDQAPGEAARIDGHALSPIPKLIHQTYPSLDLPEAFRIAVDDLRRANPTWRHRLYDDADIEAFIAASYGDGILAYYRRIDPVYGAARADLFRYLLLYRLGGVYLDIKSGFSRPIDEVIRESDRYLISRWRNRSDQQHEGFGMHVELADVPGGEIQQWYIAAAPGHPFLRAVIERVLANIDAYRPWVHGAGKAGVLRTTGPIAYTLAIQPILHLHPHRVEDHEGDFALDYNVTGNASYRTLFSGHYARQTRSVVQLHPFNRAKRRLHNLHRKLRRRWLQISGPRR